MKLEAGKRYVLNDGSVTNLMTKAGQVMFLALIGFGSRTCAWYIDGTYCGYPAAYKLSVKREYVESPPVVRQKYVNGTSSQTIIYVDEDFVIYQWDNEKHRQVLSHQAWRQLEMKLVRPKHVRYTIQYSDGSCNSYLTKELRDKALKISLNEIALVTVEFEEGEGLS